MSIPTAPSPSRATPTASALEDYNQGLSERRADSVKSYLAGQGIGAVRLSASGRGQNDPVAGNDSAAGRQQNRRVEVIISNPATSLR